MSFAELGLNDRLLKGIRTAGFRKPTPIQLQTIPVALTGRDVTGLAQTGTGKTAAFVLPMLHRFDEGERKRGVVRGLILTPTRELAQQVEEAVTSLGRFTNYASLTVYGGISMDNQLRRLKRGVDIVVATPGRLLDHLTRGTINLSHVEVLVLDEADRMFDMGFINDVRKIISHIPIKRQTFLFSATMPEEIRKLTASIQVKPEIIRIGVQSNPAETITQHFFRVPQEQKIELLGHIIQEQSMKSVLVFSRTRRGADRICKKLTKKGFKATAIHSDRSQSQRQNALAAFRQGRYHVLVATDIAARGIDVEGISHVVNYDTPAYPEDYIHRIGRTGRAELTGDAITFVSPLERRYFKGIEKLIGRDFPIQPYPGFTPLAATMKTAIEPASARNKTDKPRNGRKNGSARPAQKKRMAANAGERRISKNPARTENAGIPRKKNTINSASNDATKYDWKSLIEAGEKMINRLRGRA